MKVSLNWLSDYVDVSMPASELADIFLRIGFPVASIDENTGKTVLFGLPRNMTNFPFPAGSMMAPTMPNTTSHTSVRPKVASMSGIAIDSRNAAAKLAEVLSASIRTARRTPGKPPRRW